MHLPLSDCCGIIMVTDISHFKQSEPVFMIVILVIMIIFASQQITSAVRSVYCWSNLISWLIVSVIVVVNHTHSSHIHTYTHCAICCCVYNMKYEI